MSRRDPTNTMAQTAIFFEARLPRSGLPKLATRINESVHKPLMYCLCTGLCTVRHLAAGQ